MKKLFSILLVVVMLLSSVTVLAEDWTCQSCGNAASGNFCNNCGSPRPDYSSWKCASCGNDASGKFCNNCGSAYTPANVAQTEAISHVDYYNDADFEAALNRGEDTIGKVVCFKVLSVHPNSGAGYNLWAGDHLNFITTRRVDPVQGDTVLAKVTDVYTSLGSWFISYEILGINVDLPSEQSIDSTVISETPAVTETIIPTVSPTVAPTAIPTTEPTAPTVVSDDPDPDLTNPDSLPAEIEVLLTGAMNHEKASINSSTDKYTYFIQDYVGLNLSSIGYTSMGGDRYDRYGSGLLKVYPITLDGTYVDIEDDDVLNQYIVVAQNIAPNTEIKLVYKKDSKGKEYSNLIDYQSISSIDLVVVKLDGTIAGEIRPYTPVAIQSAPDRYTSYVRNYVGKNLATVGYTSLGGDRLDEYHAARIELCIVTADGTYVDIEDSDLLQKYVVVGQSVEPNTKIDLTYQKDSKGNEYDNLIEFCNIGVIDLQVVRVDGATYNDPVPYEPIAINISSDKYTWYIRNYVGKNLASFGYTSLGGKRMEKYGDAYVEFVLKTPDGSKIDIEDSDVLSSYVVVKQDVAPNSVMSVTYKKDSKGKEYSNLIDYQSYDKITLTLKKINKIPDEQPVVVVTDLEIPVTTAAPSTMSFEGPTQTYRDFKYVIQDDGSAVIVAYTGKSNSVSISSDFDGHDVTGIGPSVFEGHSEITSVVMWADPTFIGDRAFMGCTKLKEISISSECTSIGASAFEGCIKLNSAILWGDPEIGNRAFYGCSSLKEISIGSDTSLIGESAFEGCTSLKTAIIWGGTNISARAFYGCTSLKEMSIDSDTEFIGDYAFYGCTSLKSVTVWGSKTKIGTDAFGNCPSLKEVTQFTW